MNRKIRYNGLEGRTEELMFEAVVVAVVEEGPARVTTDPDAFADGIQANKRLKESSGDREQLDSRFCKRFPGAAFYRLGKVFKVLWPEPAGNFHAGATIITGHFGEYIYVKIRWFVVIREGRNCCTCLPIQTYGKQGVGKPSVIKDEHSIVFTGRRPPDPRPRELPSRTEYGMKQPIRVQPADPSESKMDPMSRINYAKPYTIEHNVKSFDFGQVHPDFLYLLVGNFQAVWNPAIPREMSTVPQQTYQISAGASGVWSSAVPSGYYSEITAGSSSAAAYTYQGQMHQSYAAPQGESAGLYEEDEDYYEE